MKILIAEDNRVSQMLIESSLRARGHELVVAGDGDEAWAQLSAEDPPRLAVLDWMMPGMDGIEVCRRIREASGSAYTYVIMLTARDEKDDIVEGLEAGADDYLTKPFEPKELIARVRSGERILALENALANKIAEVQQANAHVKTLQGLLPICMYCKSIRDDSDTWQRLESYISDNSEVMFSHSMCEPCLEKYHPEIKDKEEEESDITAP